jgi:hypothetical protein
MKPHENATGEDCMRPFCCGMMIAVCLVLVSGTQVHSGPIRVATFNASLNRNQQGDLVADLSNPGGTTGRSSASMPM